jgi:hypothetical protein
VARPAPLIGLALPLEGKTGSEGYQRLVTIRTLRLILSLACLVSAYVVSRAVLDWTGPTLHTFAYEPTLWLALGIGALVGAFFALVSGAARRGLFGVGHLREAKGEFPRPLSALTPAPRAPGMIGPRLLLYAQVMLTVGCFFRLYEWRLTGRHSVDFLEPAFRSATPISVLFLGWLVVETAIGNVPLWKGFLVLGFSILLSALTEAATSLAIIRW